MDTDSENHEIDDLVNPLDEDFGTPNEFNLTQREIPQVRILSNSAFQTHQDSVSQDHIIQNTEI